jgi:hypothetical protein
MAELPRDFEILGPIRDVQVIASGRGVSIAARLKRRFGGGRWRKMKGMALIRERNGVIHAAELHWYEAHGVGRVGWKIKV